MNDESTEVMEVREEPVVQPRLGRIGNDRADWLACLNAAATISHDIEDVEVVISIADRFYAALQARSFNPQAK